MGVPNLYRYLKPALKGNALSKEPPPKVDNLFLDFNGCLHGVKEKVFANGGTEKDICAHVLLYVEEMVELINPTNLLFIAVDGQAPRAKMEQQRTRRYKSRQDKALAPKKEGEEEKPFWDSNAITPGTKFMHTLDKELYKSEYLNKLSKSINVIISNTSAQGEGEQKIFRYLRKMDDEEQRNSINIIHGLDADLIMLSMCQHPQKIYLYREDDKKKTHNFLSISNLYNAIRAKHPNVSTKDYIVLSFLMGNDFLPKNYALNLRQNALDTVLIEYDKVQKKGFHMVVDGQINKNALVVLLKQLAEQEDVLVKERADYMVYKRATRHGNSPQDRFDYWPDYHRDMEVEINFGEPGWKERYYKITGCDDKIENMCKQYVNGLAWNLKYYTANDPTKDCDQGWYYPYIRAPLLCDMVKYLDKNDIVLPNSKKQYTPLEQLLIVLPPQSNGLLPISWRSYVWNNNKIFPKKFKLDPIGCIFRWECHSILPEFDEEQVLKDVSVLKLTNDEKKRQIKHGEYLL